jgi:2-polyprenyl-3-methyl-5-hydroxy-6-metoxy-1,4-benzoquinol methylase
LILKEIPPKSKVLDIGCNGGAILEWLKDNKSCEVEGVEIARNLVDICESKNLRVIKADIRTYKTNKKYDYVLLTDILEHFNRKDVYHILNNIENTAKTIIITVPYKHGVYNRANNSDHVEDYDAEDIKAMIPYFNVDSKYIYTEGYSVPSWEFIVCKKSLKSCVCG